MNNEYEGKVLNTASFLEEVLSEGALTAFSKHVDHEACYDGCLCEFYDTIIKLEKDYRDSWARLSEEIKGLREDLRVSANNKDKIIDELQANLSRLKAEADEVCTCAEDTKGGKNK